MISPLRIMEALMFPINKMRRSFLMECLAATVLPGMVAAQSFQGPNDGNAEPVTGNDIEVLGERQSETEARRDAHDYVRKTGIIKSDNPVARWNSPVCPKVIGLADAYRQIVEARLQSIANQIGVKISKAPCETNIVISFVTDGNETTRRIAARTPQLLNEVQQHARTELIDGSAPVRWWYSTSVNTSDGLNLPQLGSGAEAIAPGSEQLDFLYDVPAVRTFRSGLVQSQVVRSLQSATVIVDVNRAHGYSLDSVADYAAMVAFAEFRPAGAPPGNSLLGLFAGGTRAAKLTDFDLSFLQGLYGIPAARAGWQQRRMLVAKLVSDAEAAGRISATP